MAQPTPYNRQASFTTIQQEAPTDPLPGDTIDAELNAVKQTLDEILNNVALIQRDDGELANQSVGIDQLASEIALGIHSPTEWLTGTTYELFDTVFQNQKFYICIVEHTAGAFATDLAAAKWRLIADFTLLGNLFYATSSDTHAIETGTKAFTVETGRYFAAGEGVIVWADADNYMAGHVASYSGTNLTIDVLLAQGSGSFSGWQIRLAWGAELVLAAQTSATAAVASESNAASSASDAAASELNAASSESAAADSAEAAAQSETNIFGAEARAGAFAADAALSRQRAATSATAAAASAVAAAASAASIADDQIALKAQVFN